MKMIWRLIFVFMIVLCLSFAAGALLNKTFQLIEPVVGRYLQL
ncbi:MULTISPECIES: hypothetical protein [Pelotomaculum]|nr:MULTISPECIES: hypothetical protein [Pelotomaculum]OPX90123.1 MAG: hypothetical protein A4E54_00746 [Pelotomaculum sp. PtaB.Bin117]OPY59315.1 MAG: hypothetical protein A4E56_03247 [Pelotomaculum sp. PtaU1.Bin065]